jgi:Dihydroxyacid dehydratase/phosphogluconate dehydratase
VPKIIEAVKRGVLLAGALPMVFPTISLHEAFSHPTSMLLRNLMAMDSEEMIRAQPMDSVVLVGGCDKTLPAQMMGAISAGKPAIVIPVGPMIVGHHKGEVLGACTDCRRLWGSFRAGKIDAAEIEAVSGRLAPSAGTCMVMGTASTMALITEALGLALPGSAAVPSVHAERLRLAESAGHLAASMAVAGGPRPREIVTPGAIRNAMVVLQSIGGSTNGIIHLSAIAARAGHPIDLDEFDRLGRRVPVLVDLKPSGRFYMEHFHEAGGLPRLMVELADLLDLEAPTLGGGTLGDSLTRPADRFAQEVIRPRGAPLKREGAMAVLRGNLCPRGAGHQAIRRFRAAADPSGPGRRLRIGGGSGGADRRSRSRCGGRGCAGAAQCRAGRRPGHARGRISADPAQARHTGRHRYGADLRCPHERHGLRHHRAPYRAGGRGRRPLALVRPAT